MAGANVLVRGHVVFPVGVHIRVVVGRLIDIPFKFVRILTKSLFRHEVSVVSVVHGRFAYYFALARDSAVTRALKTKRHPLLQSEKSVLYKVNDRIQSTRQGSSTKLAAQYCF